MNLEERYNKAGADSYAGRVRLYQAANEEAPQTQGVNFMDGDGRGKWKPGSSAAEDVVQTEFKRNAPGDFRYDGGDKKPAGTNDKSYPLSRWLKRGWEKGDTYMTNNRYTTVSDVRNASKIVYNFSPLTGKSFYEAGGLSEFAKNRANPNSNSYGPSSAGLNG